MSFYASIKLNKNKGVAIISLVIHSNWKIYKCTDEYDTDYSGVMINIYKFIHKELSEYCDR